MRILLSFLIFFFAQISGAANLSLRYFVNDRYEDVKIYEINKLKVNEICRSQKKCNALKVANSKPFKVTKSTGPSFHNKGANYCWDVGAKNRILKDSKNNEYDFCVFDDGSMIDAWNLYAKHYPPKRIK